MTIKTDLYRQCITMVNQRLERLQNQITDIRHSLLSETKSSAGDKHETGRAMLQLEREKAGRQLAEIEQLKSRLSKIDIEHTSTRIKTGSLVYTSRAHYFICVSLGKLEAGDNTIYAISPETPMGQLLMGQQIGDEVVFNGNSFRIEKIL